MLDMGFINDIKYIIQKLPEKRHSLFFSATIPAAMNDLMKRFLHDPVSVSVKTRQSAENVNQDVIKVSKENKVEILHDLLIKPEFKRVIIFVRTKRAADKLSKTLQERGFEVTSIHGDKTQGQRKKALSLFKNGTVNILLATDVVARGIDIDDVSHVINFDLPQAMKIIFIELVELGVLIKSVKQLRLLNSEVDYSIKTRLIARWAFLYIPIILSHLLKPYVVEAEW